MDSSIIMQTEITEHLDVISSLSTPAFLKEIKEAASLLLDTLLRGNKILIFGNGGSASDAQHIAAEFTGRYLKERHGLPAIALTTDTSALTAIGNDYGFAQIFSRQVEALAQEGDAVIGISTSGKSENVIAGLEKARSYGCSTIGLCGNNSSMMAQRCDILLSVSSQTTARVQEAHILIAHLLCGAVERRV